MRRIGNRKRNGCSLLFYEQALNNKLCLFNVIFIVTLAVLTELQVYAAFIQVRFILACKDFEVGRDGLVGSTCRLLEPTLPLAYGGRH